MAKFRSVAAAMATCLALGGMAQAEGAPPIDAREVAGAWALRITPAQREGLEINIEVEEGDLPLTITPRGGGRIACTLRGDPAPCGSSAAGCRSPCPGVRAPPG